VSRINTGIQNPVHGAASANSSTLARAAAKFRSVEHRFLNALNWKCKTAVPRDGLAPAEFRKQDFLRKLSKGKMDPLDTMLGLVRLTEVNPNAFAELKVTRHQARRMLDNLVAHGELHSAIERQIQRIKFGLDLKDQSGYLAFVERMKTNYEGLAKALMTRTGYQEQQFSVDIEAISSGQLIQATEFARSEVLLTDKDRTDYAAILQEKLIRVKDQRRALSGSPDQKKFAGQLAKVRNPLGGFNIASPELAKMMTSALRKVGVDAPDRIVQKNIDCLKKAPTDIQAKLLPALLEAMSDVIDGVGSARYDLKRAIGEIAKAAKQTQSDVTALNLVNEHYEDHYTHRKDLNAVGRDLSEIDDASLRNFASFIDRHRWVPSHFAIFAERYPSAVPLSKIIDQLCITAAERLGWQIPTELPDGQKRDYGRFVRDFSWGNPWHGIYRFFGVSDEPEIPANRGDE